MKDVQSLQVEGSGAQEEALQKAEMSLETRAWKKASSHAAFTGFAQLFAPLPAANRSPLQQHRLAEEMLGDAFSRVPQQCSSYTLASYVQAQTQPFLMRSRGKDQCIHLCVSRAAPASS